ncbi:cupin domain-containing protein [Pseudogracilibacillus auburnensis]|uniref:ChrR-like protein with cupin domain n=1 Tax=Pseudogracilibacillus auburnensis TaxID=1494959 RepID=A0A2V3W814_9BACI|nr:cupin domain-containing protein [Pseudogracilibacillus auburnensis]MBO1001946.1 cupin domain-containing protein [Pseudogracilibacillus auburnensis]PXW90170.1 ChrR-like protein with cupin domain [Pseudogracilibacillus auburnensis]
MKHDPNKRLEGEVHVNTEKMEWDSKSLEGLFDKMLFRNEETGATIALIKFEKGAGIPMKHEHASNQFMYMLSGKYQYTETGITLEPGDYYANAKGNFHGPTVALEETVFLEIYDGPHYPSRPEFYDNDEDAQ